MSSDKLILRTVYLLKRTDKKYDGTDIYVGSTSLPLPIRLNDHRAHSKICSSKLYSRMDKVGPQKWGIVPLAVIPRCTKAEIKNVEKIWVGFLNPDLNTFSPSDVGNKWGNNTSRRRRYYLDSLASKRYHCSICDHSFGFSAGLKQHLRSQKHITGYMKLDLD